MGDFPTSVRIVEVGPRDGLQSIPRFVPTQTKIRLISRLAQAGHSSIEVTSFVSEKAVPQMRDSKEVAASLDHKDTVTYSALVPNVKGLEAAVETNITEIGVLTAATESYSQNNTNTSISGSIQRVEDIIAVAPAEIRIRGYVSCAVTCPYEGPVEPERVTELADRLLQIGCDEVILGDTTGEGSVGTVTTMLERALEVVPLQRVGVHFHDTYGQALANIAAALRLGIRNVDTAVAGLGGSPSAPGAGGNAATEDVVYHLDNLGVTTGVDLAEVALIGEWFTTELGLPNMSRAGRALASAERKEPN